MIKRTVTQSCCYSSTLVLETSKPIRKSQIPIMEAAGFVVPPSHTAAGLFYAYNDKLYISGSFGSNVFKLTMRGQQDLTELEEALEKAVQS